MSGSSAGSFAPGERVPTRLDIARDLSVSTVTVQRAFERLAIDGFVTSMGSRGTFVAGSPPHLSHYGIVFSTLPDVANDGSWSRFFTALRRAGEEITAQGDRRVSVYSGVDTHLTGSDLDRLQDDLVNQRLAGLIVISPDAFVASGLMATADHAMIPMVTVVHGEAARGLHSLMSDSEFAVVDRALDHFQEQNRHRVGALFGANVSAEYVAAFMERVHGRGMQTHARWLQGIEARYSWWARHAAEAMLTAADRPDALFIADDNLAEDAAGGVIDARVRVPDELEVVAHCNFPHQASSSLRVVRLGFDTRRIMARALLVLDRLRGGAEVELSHAAAVFEHEVDGPDETSRAVGPSSIDG